MIRIHNFAHGGRGLRVIWQCEELPVLLVVEIAFLSGCDHPFKRYTGIS